VQELPNHTASQGSTVLLLVNFVILHGFFLRLILLEGLISDTTAGDCALAELEVVAPNYLPWLLGFFSR
jgi:hypothetical protein